MNNNEIGKIRLYAMRVVFFLTFIGLLQNAWSEILFNPEPLEPFYGVAVSFWAALSILAIWGFFNPVQMIPLLILQFSYKLVWVLGVGIPLWNNGQLDAGASGLMMANGLGVILDLIVIPWVYVVRNYFKKPEW